MWYLANLATIAGFRLSDALAYALEQRAAPEDGWGTLAYTQEDASIQGGYVRDLIEAHLAGTLVVNMNSLVSSDRPGRLEYAFKRYNDDETPDFKEECGLMVLAIDYVLRQRLGTDLNTILVQNKAKLEDRAARGVLTDGKGDDR